MKGKFLFFLFISNVSLVIAQIEATRSSGIPIAQDSILFYKDTCVFTCPYQRDVLDIQWTLDILYNPNDNPESVNVLSVPFDEGEKGVLPTFRNIEIPRFDGRFILKEPNTCYISAEIVSVQKYAMSSTRTRLPVYLDLSPEKPRMEVILIEPEEGLDMTVEEPYGWWKVRFRLLPMSDNNAPPATGKYLHIEDWSDGAIWDKAFVNDTVEADNFYGKEDFFQPLYTNRFGWKYGDAIYPYRYVAGVEPVGSSTLTAYLNREERKIYVENNSSTQAIERIVIFDVAGRVRKAVERTNRSEVAIDVADLPRGLLVVQVVTREKRYLFKLWN